MAPPSAHLTTQATSSGEKQDSSLLLPLAYENPPKSANDLINSLIHEIENSHLHENPVRRRSLQSHSSTIRARPSLRVKPLVSAAEHSQYIPAQSSAKHQSTHNRGKSQTPPKIAPGSVYLSVIKTNRAERARSISGSVEARHNRPTLRIETMQAYESIENPYKLEGPPLNAGYMDPRSHNAVKRYRASSAVEEPISRFAEVHNSHASNANYPNKSKRLTNQAPPCSLCSPSSRTQRNASVDLTPPFNKDAQSESQAASSRSKSWISGKLAVSRPSDKVSSIGNVKHKESASRDMVLPISPVKAKNFMKRLGGHRTPQFSANYQREEQLRRALKEKALLAKKLTIQEINPDAFTNETSPKRKEEVATPMSPGNMDSERQDKFDQGMPFNAQAVPLTYQTKANQTIFVQPKSPSSIRRSASRKSITGSFYHWRDNIKAQTSPQSPPNQVYHDNPEASRRSSVRESTNPTRGGHDDKVPHYSPVNINDLDYVDFWVETPIPKARSPSLVEPTTPVFSSESGTSTAASSPIDASKVKITAELEGSYLPAPLRCDITSMTASITCWEDLDGCTPQFLHSLENLRENGRSESPELDSPTSVYSMEKIPIEFQDSAPQVVSVSTDQLFEDSTRNRALTAPSPPYELENSAVQHAWPMQTIDPKGKSSRGQKSHVAQLCIPSRLPGTVGIVAPVDKSIPSSLRAKSRTSTSSKTIRKSCSSADFNARDKLQQEPAGEYARSGSAPSSPIEEEEFISAMTPSILVNALMKQPSHRTQIQLRASSEEDERCSIMLSGIDQTPIPKRLSRPLDIWDVPDLHAPKGGLQLRVSRKHVNRTRREWVIESAVSPRPLLRCVDQSDSPSQKRDFWNPEGKHLFGFQKTVGSTRVAESNDGKALFVVRNASLSLMPHWTLTHKKNSQESSAQWVATGDEDFRNVVVLWGGFMVGRISVESESLRHNYIVTVKSNMNYCLMAALVTVFDDLRVDEGYF